MPPLAIDVMEAHRAALLRADDAAMRAMAQRWLQIEQALQAQLDALILEILQQGGGPLTMWQLVRLRRYQTLLEQLNAQLAPFATYVTQDITTRQRTAGMEAIDSSTLAINAAAADAGIQLQFDRLPVSNVERMVGLAGDGSPLRTILQSASTTGADALAQQLIQGVALGLNPREIARRAMRQGLATSFTRMVTIARTEVLRVARQTTLDNYRHSKAVRAYRRVASKSQRTCIACLALDGEIYPLTTPFEEHVNGRCVPVPVLIRGTPLAYENGKEWFARQPESVQRQMMGPGRWDLWQSGDVTWNDLVRIHEDETWGNSPQVTPVRDLERVAGRQAVRPQRTRRAQATTPAAAPVPSASPTAISRSLDLPPATTPTGRAIADAVAAIDQVHDGAALERCQVIEEPIPNAYGYYDPYEVKIGIDNGPAAVRPHMTMLHETGHYLDHKALGIAIDNRRVSDAAYQDWFAAVITSQRIRDLFLAYQSALDPDEMSHLYYLLSPPEIWARSYAQFIAQRSGNRVILDELVVMQTTNLQIQWEDADFADIDRAIEAILREVGWMQ